jgi:hypothetical protein
MGELLPRLSVSSGCMTFRIRMTDSQTWQSRAISLVSRNSLISCEDFSVGNESVQLMLADVTRELLEKAKAAKKDAAQSGSDFDKGRHFALYEVVSLLAQQADAFGIDRGAIGLAEIDPEQDMLG